MTLRKLFLYSVALISSCQYFPALADAPPASAIRQYINFKDSVGLVDYYKSDEIPDNGAVTVNGLDWTLDGTMKTRLAYSLVAPAISVLASIVPPYLPRYFWVYTSTTGTNYFVAKIDEQLRAINSFTSDVQLGQIQRAKLDHIVSGGILYVVNETSPILKIVETNPLNVLTLKMTLLNKSPAGNIIKPHLDRLIVAGSTRASEEMTVYFSSADDFDTWSPENFFEVNSITNGERITCMGDSIFGNLPLFTNKTTRLITGTEYPSVVDAVNAPDIAGNITVKNISENIGCVNQETVKTVKGKTVFFSAGQNQTTPGIYEFNGVTVKERTKQYRRWFNNSVLISTDILPTAFVYQDNYCVNLASVNAIYADQLFCIDADDRLTKRIIVSNALAGNNIIPPTIGMMDFIGSQGYFLNGFNVRPQSTNPGENALIYKYNDSGTTRDSITSNAAKINIEWDYKTKDFDMKDKNRVKTPERAYFKHATSSASRVVDVIATYDFGPASTTWRIDTSSFTNYTDGPVRTILKTQVDAIQRLAFPAGIKFNFINFEVRGSTPVSLSYIDFYANPDVYK